MVVGNPEGGFVGATVGTHVEGNEVGASEGTIVGAKEGV
jgi:hypothetical protein